MEMTFHVLQVGLGVLLLTVDALKHFLAMFLSNAGALLPLFGVLGQDLINATARGMGRWK